MLFAFALLCNTLTHFVIRAIYARPHMEADIRRRLVASKEDDVKKKLDKTQQENEKLRGRGLHSFPFQLNLSSSFHRITQLKS